MILHDNMLIEYDGINSHHSIEFVIIRVTEFQRIRDNKFHRILLIGENKFSEFVMTIFNI